MLENFVTYVNVCSFKELSATTYVVAFLGMTVSFNSCSGDFQFSLADGVCPDVLTAAPVTTRGNYSIRAHQVSLHFLRYPWVSYFWWHHQLGDLSQNKWYETTTSASFVIKPPKCFTCDNIWCNSNKQREESEPSAHITDKRLLVKPDQVSSSVLKWAKAHFTSYSFSLFPNCNSIILSLKSYMVFL